jgi:hypothetical protein
VGGSTHTASARHPGVAASAFIATDVPTAATFSARARTARRPCSASAIPSEANTSAATSGMAACTAATTGTCL